MYDLRAENTGRPSGCYEVLSTKTKEFLEERVGTAVDDRRHSQVVHLSKAISVHDFRQQVVQKCSPDALTLCDELFRLQFIPAHKTYKYASKYTSFLEAKKMVQQQQWRLEHEDSHYSACIFRYMHEYAVLYREYSRFVSLDDKHKIKIGHPGCPAAAAEECGR